MVLILAAEVRPRPRQDSNPGSVADSPSRGLPCAGCLPAGPFYQPTESHGLPRSRGSKNPGLAPATPPGVVPGSPLLWQTRPASRPHDQPPAPKELSVQF